MDNIEEITIKNFQYLGWLARAEYNPKGYTQNLQAEGETPIEALENLMLKLNE